MTPVELLLSKLPGAKSNGNGWSARCPAHEDRNPSLSVSGGDDGRALVKCHAGCTTEAVVAELGLCMADLMPAPEARPAKHAKSGRCHATAKDAVASLERRHGPRSTQWEYRDANGVAVGIVARWDDREGKVIRPVARHGDGWRIAAMPAPRPPYGLPDLAKAKLVIVAEGEKAADAARSLGFTATTSAGGAQAANQTDWTPLAGKEVWILPDNDAPGLKYADIVAVTLAKLSPAPAVKMIHLPGLPDKGDVVDWIDAHGDAAEPEGMRAELEALAAAALPPRAPLTVPAAKREAHFVPELLCMADVVPVEVPWLWPGRIPLGRITLLVGRPGAGKSFLTCDLAARLSTAADWPAGGGAAPLADTLFICAEDDPADTIAPRLVAAGANRQKVHLLKAAKLVEATGKETTVAFDLGNVELIRESLERLPYCRLVVIDPVGSYLGGGVDAHRDNEVRSVLAPLAALASERGVAVVLVCHTRKASADFADDTALGSRAFAALARSVLHLSADAGDRTRKLLLPGKNNLTAETPGLAFRIAGEQPRLEWEATPLDGVHADDVQAGAGGATRRGPEPQARNAAAQWLRQLLRGSPSPAADIKQQADAAGLSWASVRRAQQELGIVPRKQTFSGGWMWELPANCEGAHDDGDDSRRCSNGNELEHLRVSPGETAPKSATNLEGARVAVNLDAFEPGANNPNTFAAPGELFPDARGLPD